MEIKLHTTGIFHNGVPAGDLKINFSGNSVKLSEVYTNALKLFLEQGILFDENSLLIAVDGKVVAQKLWNEYDAVDGQTCYLFPALAGG